MRLRVARSSDDGHDGEGEQAEGAEGEGPLAEQGKRVKPCREVRTVEPDPVQSRDDHGDREDQREGEEKTQKDPGGFEAGTDGARLSRFRHKGKFTAGGGFSGTGAGGRLRR